MKEGRDLSSRTGGLHPRCPCHTQTRGHEGRGPRPHTLELPVVECVPPDEEHGPAVSQDLSYESLPCSPLRDGHDCVTQGEPSHKPSQNRTDAREEEGKPITSHGKGKSADGQRQRVTKGGAGDEEAHGHASAGGEILVCDDHHAGRVRSSHGDTHHGVQDQAGKKIPCQECETQGADPGRKEGPQIDLPSTDPVCNDGEDDQGECVPQQETTGDGTRLDGGHGPFLLEDREGGCIGHKDEAVADPRRANPSQPQIERRPFHGEGLMIIFS